MKRIKAETVAKNLIKSNGLTQAIKIAHRSINSVVAAELPKGEVFYPTMPKGASVQADKDRKATSNFWSHVSGILNKAGK